MKIFVGCDHAGVKEKNELKKMLETSAADVIDCGVEKGHSVDYPLIAQKLCDYILAEDEDSIGVLICGTGIGMSMMANRNKGIRAAVVYDEATALLAKAHNNANVICFGARTLGSEKIQKFTQLFLKSSYFGYEVEGERHERRVKMLDEQKA